MSSQRAEQFKNQGNAYYKDGDFASAEKLYSQAIICDSTNPAYFTNRALMRIKLQKWDEAIHDCQRAIELAPESMKGHHYLAQALVHRNTPNEGLKHAKKAYELALAQNSPSTTVIVGIVLEAKKKVWEAKERQRIAAESELLEELCQNIQEKGHQEKEATRRNAEGHLSEEDLRYELDSIDEDTDRKMARLRDVFAMSDEKHRIRTVPDFLIDSISFTIMLDPVVTKYGQSYDRATILEHLRRSKTDPLTREPMTEDDLRPNIALKQACAEFLDNNGWAVDY